MAKKAKQRAKHDGIPRTAAAAVKHRFKRVDVNFSKMDAKEKKNWTPISSVNAKRGALALVRRPTAARPPRRVIPTADPNVYIVCYYNSTTGNYDLNCHQIPASEIDSA
jgi:hypothetical protein